MIYYHSSEQMKELGNETIHLIVTSPPYPMIKKWDKLFEEINFEYQHSILDTVWLECYRILIPGGICCINIGDATRTINGNFECYPNFSRITMKMKGIGFTSLIPILWKKISNRPNAFLGSGFYPPNAYVSQDCEYIGIYRKGSLRKIFKHESIKEKSKFSKKERDLWFSQIWSIPGAKNAKETSSFPKEIPYRLIRMFSFIGETILDPFSGSGTTGMIANELNRSFVGYEIA